MAKIVVAEDDAHILRVICMWLSRQKHEVFEANNGRRALELVEQHRPQILVTDVNMPEMDGMQLMQTLRERGLQPAGVVVLTNRWDHKEIGEQLATAGVHVIPKPFSPTKLAGIISELATGSPASN